MSAEQGDDAGGQDSTTSAAVVARSHDGPQASPNGDAPFGLDDAAALTPDSEGSLAGEAARSQQGDGGLVAAVQGLSPPRLGPSWGRNPRGLPSSSVAGGVANLPSPRSPS